MPDTYRAQAPGLKTFVVATYAFLSVDHHSHFTHMRRLRKEKYCIQAGLARSADPEPLPVPQGRVDLALTVVLAPAGALPRGHSPEHGFPPFVGPRSGQPQDLSHPGLGEWKPCLGNRLLPSPPPPTTSAEAAGFREEPPVPPTWLTASEIRDNLAQLHPIHTWLLVSLAPSNLSGPCISVTFPTAPRLSLGRGFGIQPCQGREEAGNMEESRCPSWLGEMAVDLHRKPGRLQGPGRRQG